MQNPFFSSLPSSFQKEFELLPAALDAVMPVNAKQLKELPYAVRDLSALLTTEREFLSRPYWGVPRLTSAYLRYFLPWNILRFASILSNRQFSSLQAETSLLLDCGSGPLTFTIALWLTRPDLRKKKLKFICTDVNQHPLNLGREIFSYLRQQEQQESPWEVHCMRAPLEQAAQLTRSKFGQISFLCLANVLNEWEGKKARHLSLEERMDEFFGSIIPTLAPKGEVLLMEPGTRLGGKLITTAREVARLQESASPSMFAVAPCPHQGPCPLSNLHSEEKTFTHRTNAWCHSNIPPAFVPEFLHDLSQKAGLSKDTLSISYLHLVSKSTPTLQQTGTQQSPAQSTNTITMELLNARILSEAFPLPGQNGRARYACTEQGLALILDSAYLKPYTVCSVQKIPGKDGKSGAFLAILPQKKADLSISTAQEKTIKPKVTPKKERNNLHKKGSKNEYSRH